MANIAQNRYPEAFMPGIKRLIEWERAENPSPPDDEAMAAKMAHYRGKGGTEDYCPQKAHFCGDALLCHLLKRLGYEKTVEEFKKMKKWYA